CEEQGTNRSKLPKTPVETGSAPSHSRRRRGKPRSYGGIRQPGLRFDGLRAFFHSLGFGSIRFPMTGWRDVRFGGRPGERPRLLVTTRQHEVETAAWGSRSTYLVSAVTRFQSAGGEFPSAFFQMQLSGEPVHRQRHGRSRNFNMRQAAVPHHEL